MSNQPAEIEIARFVTFCIWFDTTDASNQGWAWSYGLHDEHGGEHESGPLPHRRRDCSMRTLRRALGKELGGDMRKALRGAVFVRKNENGLDNFVARVSL